MWEKVMTRFYVPVVRLQVLILSVEVGVFREVRENDALYERE